MEKEYVYVLVSSGNWDGSFVDLNVYASKADVKEAFRVAVQEAVNNYKENYDESDLSIDIDDENMCCEIHLTGWYDEHNHTIDVYTRDVIYNA